LQVLRNRIAEARVLAQRVKQICLDRSRQVEATGGRADYWLIATLAEAELIGGRYAEAEVAYRTAVQLVQGNWRELCSTRRQARLLAAPLGLAPGFVERLFPLISIAVFAAPALARLAAEGKMSKWEQRQKEELKQRLAAADVVCGYASALSPADLLFIETMLATGREINVVLPCPRQVCRRVFEPAPAWAARFDSLLSRVNLVTEDTQPSCLDEGVNRAFARLRALGAGLLRAQRLDAALQVWGMEDARLPAAWQNSSSVSSSFASISCPYETIKEEPWFSPTGPAQPANGAVREENYAIRAMLFGDVKGYSKLSDVELLRFAREFMRRAADVLGDILPASCPGAPPVTGCSWCLPTWRSRRRWRCNCATWWQAPDGTNAGCRQIWESASRWMPARSIPLKIPSPNMTKYAARTSTVLPASSRSPRRTKCMRAKRSLPSLLPPAVRPFGSTMWVKPNCPRGLG
jgi:hypothetical protein